MWNLYKVELEKRLAQYCKSLDKADDCIFFKVNMIKTVSETEARLKPRSFNHQALSVAADSIVGMLI